MGAVRRHDSPAREIPPFANGRYSRDDTEAELVNKMILPMLQNELANVSPKTRVENQRPMASTFLIEKIYVTSYREIRVLAKL